MKTQIIKLLKEHLRDREEPEIKVLLESLDEMSEEAVKGIALLVLDANIVLINQLKQYRLQHAYDKKN
jgi:hypothetical protein